MEPMTDTTTSFTKNTAAPLPPVASLPVASLPDPPAWDPAASDGAVPRPRFRLHRSRNDRMLGGVCGGLAESLDADPALIRLALVALTVLGAGSGVLLYAAAWLLAPEADAA